jgi:hypothetical protein
MSSTIPFHGNAVDMLPDGVIPVPGTRKRKPAFSMNDPDNVEIARLATQAAKKKAKLSMVNSGKDFENTHQKKSAGPKSNHQLSNSKNKKTVPQNRQPSVESESDVDDFPHNSHNNHENVAIAVDGSESDDDDIQIVEQPAESAEEELS